MDPAAIRFQERHVARLIKPLPAGVAAHVVSRHIELIGAPDARSTSPVFVANGYLRDEVHELRAGRVDKAYDEQAIRDFAENYSGLCGRLRSLRGAEDFTRGCGIALPHRGRYSTDGAIAARLNCPRWWRRAIRKDWTRRSENALRETGLIRKGRAPYASDEAVRHRKRQRERQASFLKAHAMVNELGEQLNLLELAEHSISNPAIRRGEFMTRARGFEEIAIAHKHVAEFITLTTPSRFHAELSRGGRNPNHARETVRDAQQWLCKQWAKARAAFKRLSILFYGFRIAEPHHDGTPHWHMLLFFRARDVAQARFILRGLWLADSGSEPGAQERRITFEAIDASKGSATGYVAKYVSKNIDGHGDIGSADDNETGKPVADGIARVEAWARVHGIRQFQQLGGPPVGLYRETRRLRAPVKDPDIEAARIAADGGDWAAFTHNVGGIAAGRRTNLRLETAETGARNCYGEIKPPQIVGIRYASAVELTRPHTWRVEKCSASSITSGSTAPASQSDSQPTPSGIGSSVLSRLFSDLGPVAITVLGAPGLNSPSAWTNSRETSQAGPHD